jgi:molybdopterin-guanine dinucleotide biosynthesis protein A
MVATREGSELVRQPVFLLMKATLLESLVAYLHAGERKIDPWTAQQRRVLVEFEDPAAFFNANTLEELRQLQAGG